MEIGLYTSIALAYNGVMDRAHETTGLPPDFRLLPGETVLSVTSHEPRTFQHTPSSLEQIMRLTRSPSPDDIGTYGPSIASLAFDVSMKTSVTADQSPLTYASGNALPHMPAPEHLRLYEVVFGRDSLRVAIDLISSYPALARSTVLRLAELQGVTTDQAREEEPGKIVHEARDADDPIALQLSRELGWGWPYYGSIDATPEFLRTLAAYCSRSSEGADFLSARYIDRTGTEHTISYAMSIAVDWILHNLHKNPEGLLEFKSMLPQGIENQVWKDSWDAYHHSDGSDANHADGIASIEVQTTTYDALLDIAHLYEHALGNTLKAGQLREHADALRNAIITYFWTDDKGGYFVLGTDRDPKGKLRQLKLRTSNMGHVLNSRLLEDDSLESAAMRGAIITQLTSPELLTPSGIRTLASDEYRYRPGSYHNGSIWLWDTHHIAKGLRRHGHGELADELDRRLLNVVDTTKVFPEYVRGDDSDIPRLNTQTIVLWDSLAHRINKVEQPPQEVQAWTVAAILAIKRRMARRGLFAATPQMHN